MKRFVATLPGPGDYLDPRELDSWLAVTGVRYRTVPLTPERILAGLRAGRTNA